MKNKKPSSNALLNLRKTSKLLSLVLATTIASPALSGFSLPAMPEWLKNGVEYMKVKGAELQNGATKLKDSAIELKNKTVDYCKENKVKAVVFGSGASMLAAIGLGTGAYKLFAKNALPKLPNAIPGKLSTKPVNLIGKLNSKLTGKPVALSTLAKNVKVGGVMTKTVTPSVFAKFKGVAFSTPALVTYGVLGIAAITTLIYKFWHYKKAQAKLTEDQNANEKIAKKELEECISESEKVRKKEIFLKHFTEKIKANGIKLLEEEKEWQEEKENNNKPIKFNMPKNCIIPEYVEKEEKERIENEKRNPLAKIAREENEARNKLDRLKKQSVEKDDNNVNPLKTSLISTNFPGLGDNDKQKFRDGRSQKHLKPNFLDGQKTYSEPKKKNLHESVGGVGEI